MKQTVWIVLIVVALVAGGVGGYFFAGPAAAPDAELADQVNQLQQTVESLQGQLDEMAKAADLDGLQQQVDSLAQQVEGGAAPGGGWRTAYVNAEQVFLKYKGTATAVRQFSEEKERMQEELTQLQEQFQGGQITQEEYQQRYQEIQQELQQLDLELTSKVQQKMIGVISEVAQEKGYDWVTRKKDVILYAKSGLMEDITDLVIERLNAELEAEGTSES